MTRARKEAATARTAVLQAVAAVAGLRAEQSRSAAATTVTEAEQLLASAQLRDLVNAAPVGRRWQTARVTSHADPAVQGGLAPAATATDVRAVAVANARTCTGSGQAWRGQLPAADAARMLEISTAVANSPWDQTHDVRAQASVLAARLIMRGYTYAAVGRAARVTSVTIANWCARVPQAALSDVTEDEPHQEPLTVRVSATERYPVPAVDADRLRELRMRLEGDASDPQAGAALDLLCARLRRRGYTLRAIAGVIDVGPWTVSQRAGRVPEDQLAGIEPEVSRTAPERPTPRRERARLTEQEVARALELQPVANRRRRGTPTDSETGRAFAEYMKILLAGHERGVTAYTMGQQLEMTTGGIRSRIERVLGTLPPSRRPKSGEPVEPRGPLDGLEEDILRLKQHLVDSEVRPGRGPGDADRREASRAFDAALAGLVRQRNVSLTPLAEALGRSRSTLAPRVAAHERRTGGHAPGHLDDDEVVDVLDDDGIGPNGSVVPQRVGRLTDFTAETTPVPADAPPSPATVDPSAQHASTTAHMTLLRRLRRAAQAGGHPTQAWDIGQDACFTYDGVLVNVEVKSVGSGSGIEQYRLGVGQLAEQMQHHLDHLAAGTPWYVESQVRAVAGVLVVTDDAVSGVWRRLAARLGITIWSADRALRVFADPHVPGLPAGLLPVEFGGAASTGSRCCATDR